MRHLKKHTFSFLYNFAFMAMLFNAASVYADDLKNSCMKEGLRLENLANQEGNLAEVSLTKEGSATPLATKSSENSILHFKQALEKYICASKAGNHQASLNAVRLMGSGLVEAVPDSVIEQYLLDAANAEIPDAQTGLYEYYCEMKLTGCKQRDKAWYWLNRAAKNNDSVALINIGFAYEKGDSIPKDIKLAFNYYKLAAVSGHKLGKKNACRLLINGLYIDNTYIKTCR